MSLPVHLLLIFVHLLAAIVWLGGMVFAHFALRPAAVATLEPPLRLPLMVAALGRFFRIVAVAVVAILLTGFALLAQVGFAQAPAGWHAMATIGVVMSVNFAFIYARLFPRLSERVAARTWPDAAKVLDRIRSLVLVNLWLGVAAVAAAVFVRM
jgi:uncharacterized membrane protein